MQSNQSFANPQTIPYESATGAFGATTASRSYIGPRGRKGLVRDIEVFLTADAIGTTTVPEVTVGTAAGDTTYARYRLGTAPAAGLPAAATPQRARSLVTGSGAAQTATDFPNHVELEKTFIPADTAFVISGKAGVGTPAGTGTHRVEIDWF